MSVSNLAIAPSARACHDRFHARTSRRSRTRRGSGPTRRPLADRDPPAASDVGYVRRSSSDWSPGTSAMGAGAGTPTSDDELPLSECFSRAATVDFY
eukprot:UN0181